MAEEVKPVEPPVAAATEVEPTKTENVESPTPDQPVETAVAAPVTAPEAEGTTAASRADEAKVEETPVAEAAPALPELTNLKWGPISDKLAAIYRRLPGILEKSKHSEVYGVQLTYVEGPAEPAFATLLILQKFLRANSDDLEKAVDQLTATLAWRAEKKPLESLAAEHDRSAYEGLGYVQVLPKAAEVAGPGEVLTWNIYGSVTDYKKTFANLDSFLSWRVALMEAAIDKLDLQNATVPIPNFNQGADPYQIIQVHDYLNVSFLRMDADAKAASKATIAVFRDFYPEMLSRKFFVNVPLLMGWLYKATTLVLPEATVKKFRVLSYGKELAAELGDAIPEVYGGKGVKEVKELGDPVRLSAAPAEEAEAKTEAPAAPAATATQETAAAPPADA
ncbi:Non-classical phosphatidylinositol transfer protein (PITP) [Arthrobotrys musiformis]|uniref:Phosphatidylinositol transfer protein SFH5 n=1 Tax=Arthrobotrys musiformis TaxID=47236 RepID=A0AAV9WA72_9PEZI